MDRAASFEEDYDTRDVIDAVLFTLPGRHRLLNHGAAGALKVIAVPEWHDQVNHLVTGEELPDAIGGQNEEFVLVVGLELLDL